ncbi:MAG: hypothetical protein CSA95_02055 [Bacteroidetes bacterium]|nr:MAG: hypothetical protein CSA95_02055 [Bacteroidota bacterium]
MIVLGITGTLGAGKGTIVAYLKEQYHFKHYSVRAYLTAVIEARGLPVNRDSMVLVANELRAKYAPSFIVDELYEKAAKEGHPCIIESIRTPGEVESLRAKKSFRLLAVDAQAEIRYHRIVGRNSATDHVSYEEFIANEQREMNAVDPHKQNLSKCMEMADYHLDNSENLEHLYAQVETLIKKILP